MEDKFWNFVKEHQNDDTNRLLLSKSKWKDIDVDTAVCCIESRKKLRTKLPTWYSQDRLLYINTLSAEQCSSEATASYKAELAKNLMEKVGKGRKIADLTGGLGVDCHAFSKVAEAVLYNEANPRLYKATKENFKTLGADNIQTSNYLICPTQSPCNSASNATDNSVSTPEETNLTTKELLDGFKPDLIYLDPARRDNVGKKVFLLEDCSPDVASLKDELLEIASIVMVKLSPMADISMVIKRLGSHCREVHVVSAMGECKELLIVMERNWDGGYCLVINENGNVLRFDPQDETKATVRLAEKIVGTNEQTYLFEPGKAMLKAGCFNLISELFGLEKAGRSSHIYFTKSEDKALAASRFGKIYKVIEAEFFNNKTIKGFAKTYPGADVTSRNLPISSDDLRMRMYGKGRSKQPRPDKIHIFAFTSDVEGKVIVAATPSSRI